MITATIISFALTFAPIALALVATRGRTVDGRQPFPVSTLRNSFTAGLGL
jgi:hypothetical protein